MGLWESIKEDFYVKDKRSCQPSAPAVSLEKPQQVDAFEQLHNKHYNYNTVKLVIANTLRLGIDNYAPSARVIESIHNIGKSSVNRALLLLEEDGWVKREVVGKDNPRNVRYRILISKYEADKYYDLYYSFYKKKLRKPSHVPMKWDRLKAVGQ